MMSKAEPIDIKLLPDAQLTGILENLQRSIDSMCEECSPPPEVFKLLQNIEKELDSRKPI